MEEILKYFVTILTQRGATIEEVDQFQHTFEKYIIGERKDVSISVDPDSERAGQE